MVSLAELTDAIRVLWPQLYQRGTIQHLHCDKYELPDGRKVTIRVLVMAPPKGPTE